MRRKHKCLNREWIGMISQNLVHSRLSVYVERLDLLTSLPITIVKKRQTVSVYFAQSLKKKKQIVQYRTDRRIICSPCNFSTINMLGMENFPEYEVPGARKVQFYPYESNGGSVVAIAGEDFAVIGADTRLSSGYSIHTRTQNKLFRLSDKTVLASTGCWCDTLALTSLVKVRMQMYKDQHQKSMSTPAVAQMLSILMYNRRFFPYYVSNVLAGLDQNGKGVVYSYDPIGHCEMTTYRAGGSAGPLLQPVLDNQIGQKNMLNVDPEPVKMEKAVSIIKDTFISATERDIYTGDSVIINIITKDGIKEETLHLRKD